MSDTAKIDRALNKMYTRLQESGWTTSEIMVGEQYIAFILKICNVAGIAYGNWRFPHIMRLMADCLEEIIVETHQDMPDQKDVDGK